MIRKRRRIENRTDYKARRIMIRGEKPRIVVRKTNRYILAQYVESEEAQDKVIINLTSKELAELDRKSVV